LFQTEIVDLHGNIIEFTPTRNGSKNHAALSSPKQGPFEYKELPAQVSYMALNDFGDEKILRDFEAKLGEAQRAKTSGPEPRPCTFLPRSVRGTRYLNVLRKFVFPNVHIEKRTQRRRAAPKISLALEPKQPETAHVALFPKPKRVQ